MNKFQFDSRGSELRVGEADDYVVDGVDGMMRWGETMVNNCSEMMGTECYVVRLLLSSVAPLPLALYPLQITKTLAEMIVN